MIVVGRSLAVHRNRFAVDDQLVVLVREFAFEPAVCRVVLEHVDHVVRRNERI